MKCPSCKNIQLKAMRLELGLPVLSCEHCNGASISLLHYRDWAERTAHINDAGKNNDMNAQLLAENESQTVLHCPKCTKIMSKYRISGCTKNRLDLCVSCDEAWLDGGEWALLKALQLSKNIPAIFTDSWQSKINQEIRKKQHRDRFAKLIGESDIDKVDAFKAWLDKHEKRAEILTFINHG